VNTGARLYKLDKTVSGGWAIRILHNNEKCVLHIRSEMKLDTSVNYALLHLKMILFSEYHLITKNSSFSNPLGSRVSCTQFSCNYVYNEGLNI
jgi:hypothetical protein